MCLVLWLARGIVQYPACRAEHLTLADISSGRFAIAYACPNQPRAAEESACTWDYSPVKKSRVGGVKFGSAFIFPEENAYLWCFIVHFASMVNK